MLCGSLSLLSAVDQQETIANAFVFPLLVVLFGVSCLAETSRAPFDLSEAETELIAGFHVELAGIGFTLFFLAEFMHIVSSSLCLVVLFGAGWHGHFGSSLRAYSPPSIEPGALLEAAHDRMTA